CEYGPGAFIGGRYSRPQGAGQGQRRVTFGSRQVAVPARDGQAVRVTDDGNRVDREREIQISHHPPNDGQLLSILLPQDRDIWLDQIEQLKHHCEHTVEEPRPEDTFEDVAQLAGAHRDHLLDRIDLLMGGGEDDVYPLLCTDGDVVGQGPRIAVKVRTEAELQRVDKYGYHERSVAPGNLPRPPEQRAMPAMQGAHGRNEDDWGPQARAAGGQAAPRPGQHGDHAADPESTPSSRCASAEVR